METVQLSFNPLAANVTICDKCGIPKPGNAGYYWHMCDNCRERDGQELVDCDGGCDTKNWSEDMYVDSYFFTPWDDEPTETGFTFCQECIDSGYQDGSDQFYCDWCSRDIAESNGYHSYYRLIQEGSMVCLKCIEDELKVKGVAAFEEEFELIIKGESMFGMFFNSGELEGEGWQAAEGFDNIRIDGENRGKVGDMVKSLNDEGRLAIIAYESLSIIGDEGYITVFSKEVA